MGSCGCPSWKAHCLHLIAEELMVGAPDNLMGALCMTIWWVLFAKEPWVGAFDNAGVIHHWTSVLEQTCHTLICTPKLQGSHATIVLNQSHQGFPTHTSCCCPLLWQACASLIKAMDGKLPYLPTYIGILTQMLRCTVAVGGITGFLVALLNGVRREWNCRVIVELPLSV